jgi:hypothetical protein
METGVAYHVDEDAAAHDAAAFAPVCGPVRYRGTAGFSRSMLTMNSIRLGRESILKSQPVVEDLSSLIGMLEMQISTSASQSN